jgi:hypothetical protein
MARNNNPADTVKVARIPPRANVKVGKPGKVVTSAMRMKTAFPIMGDSVMGSGGNFYSPELSTDFLELPQTVDEQRNFYRFFYDHDEFIGQAVDLTAELPLSKIRLRMPKARNREIAEKAMRFCERWSRKIGLLHRLISIVHDYFLIGEAFIFAEDTSPDMPEDVRSYPVREVLVDGTTTEEWVEHEDADERAVGWLKRNYKGWTALRVLPPEQVHMESFPFTDAKLLELIVDSKTKGIVNKAQSGDVRAMQIVDSMPQEITEAVLSGQNLPLNTDPEAGSFCYHMARKKSDYEPRGKSILQRCLRTLVFRDKVRQALTSIASRHMTPFRLVWAEDMDDAQTEELREQVDIALQDPDYSIITNFEVHWEEMGAEQRLPNWDWVYEQTNKQLYAGLGMTESLLSGESSYSGDRIHLEVINTRFMLLREVLQDFVEDYLFRPMCARMGFVEEDEDGNLDVVTPRLSFSRLALRDNQETFDALFNMYQKGSLDVDVILDLLNIDPMTTKEKIEKDMLTVNDALFNEILRSAYSAAGNAMAEQTDLTEVLAEKMGLKYKPPEEGGGGRF